MPALQHRLGQHPCAGAKLQHRAGAGRVDLAGDGAAQRPAGWRNRANILGTRHQGAQKPQISGKYVGG